MTGQAAKVLGPCPGLVTAMAKFRLGDRQQARTALAAEINAFDWSMARVRAHDQWLWHILHREAEALIFPNTAAFLEGKYEPRDNTERLILLGACRFKNRTCAAARLYADAFAADATLADDLQFSHRYKAARAAALVGSARGEDVAGVGEPERARWRQQARQWLRADLAAWNQALDRDPSATRDKVRQVATWLSDPDLAGFFELAELDKLPPDERKDCVALSKEIDGLLTRAGGTAPKP
jgi:serine/threonine-protein kinase